MNKNSKAILMSLADNISSLLLGTLGEENVESIFLSGSVAEGRIASFEEKGVIEIYSDLDIYVIISRATDLEEARTLGRSLIKDLKLETDYYRLFRMPDIGVYTENNLFEQPHRPSTVDIHGCFKVLYGREDIPAATSIFQHASIPKEEALYLLENRLIEEAWVVEGLKSDMSDGYKRYAYYNSLKNCLDVWNAVLIVHGQYSPEFERRIEAFGKQSNRDAFYLEQDAMDLVESSLSSLTQLQQAILEQKASFANFRQNAGKLLVTTWKKIAETCFDLTPPATWHDTVMKRSRGRSITGNLREARILARRFGRGLGSAFKIWTRSPRTRPMNTLRLAGLCEVLSYAHNRDPHPEYSPAGLLAYLELLTRGLGFTSGSLFQRARQLYKAVS